MDRRLAAFPVSTLLVSARRRLPLAVTAVAALLASTLAVTAIAPRVSAANARIPAGGVLRVSVPVAIGGKTVVGQLTVDQAQGAGFVTAYGCDDGIPTNTDGTISRSDLNFDGGVSPVASNRLLVQADNNGDICF